MKNELIIISFYDLAFASIFILIVGILSIILKLNIERKLLLGAVRTVVQLIALGFILKWIF